MKRRLMVQGLRSGGPITGAIVNALMGTLIAGAVGGLAGCSSFATSQPLEPANVGELVGTRIDPPAAATPSRAPSGQPSPATGVASPLSAIVPDLPWDRFFTEPRLQALIRLALENNRDLRVAALNVEQARAQAAQRDADLWPTVNAGISGTRVPTNVGGVSTTVTGGLATAAYEVDLSGRLRQASTAAQEQLRASEFVQAAARASLIAAVAAAHVNLRADEALLAITQDTLRSRAEGLQVVQGRVKAGAASALDETQAQALLQAARAALAQVKRQQALDESSLVLLIGRPLPGDLPASQPADRPSPSAAPAGAPAAATLPSVLPNDLPSNVLTRRPDIAAAEAQLRASQANVEAARLALFPRISLTASFGQASKDLGSLFAGGTWVWGVAPQLLAPIFDAGRLRAAQAQAQALAQSNLAQYEKAIQVAFKEVRDALAAQATLGEQLQALNLQLQAEAERARMSELRWKLGASAYIDVLDAQRSLYAAQTAWVQLRAQLQVNEGTLYKVLGGGVN